MLEIEENSVFMPSELVKAAIGKYASKPPSFWSFWPAWQFFLIKKVKSFQFECLLDQQLSNFEQKQPFHDKKWFFFSKYLSLVRSQ